MSAFAGLERFATPEDPTVRPKMRTLADITTQPMRLLCFDQSLANTGWVVLQRNGGGLWVLGAGNIKTDETKFKGVTQTLLRAEQVFRLADEMLGSSNPWGLDGICYETPAAGPSAKRTDASLSAAVAVRILGAVRMLPVRQISAQRAKNWICCLPNADKATAHAALKQAFADVIGDYAKHITNEARRDALLVGLRYLADCKEGAADGQ